MLTYILTTKQARSPHQSNVYRQALIEAEQLSDPALDGWVNALGHELAALEDLDAISAQVQRPLVCDRWAAASFVQRRRQERFAAGTGPDPHSDWSEGWKALAKRVRRETDIVAMFESFAYPLIQQGKEFAGPCPDCGGVDRFRVFPEPDGRFEAPHAWCRRCGAWYDPIQVVRRLGANIGFFDAVAALAETLGLSIPARKLSRPADGGSASKEDRPTTPQHPVRFEIRRGQAVSR